MAYTGWVDVSKNGSPTTLHKDRHPDYVLLTFKRATGDARGDC